MTNYNDSLQTLIDDFFIWVYTDRIRDVFGKDWLDKVRQEDQKIRTRFEKEFKLLVMGDFKRGKSTLVNALLEMPIVTTDVTPETITINEVGYGDELYVEAVLVDGSRVILELDEIVSDQLTGMVTSWSDTDLTNTSFPSVLTPNKVQQLEEALSDSFNITDLQILTRHITHQDLDEISLGKNKKIIISDLVSQARKRGWLTQLVEKSFEEAPTNSSLKNFVTWYNTEINIYETKLIDNMPEALYRKIENTLIQIDEFATQEALNILSDDPRLKLWKNKFAVAPTPELRVENTISNLQHHCDKDRINALVILLEVVAKKNNHLESQLHQLAKELTEANYRIRIMRHQKTQRPKGFLHEKAQEKLLQPLPKGIDSLSHLEIKAPIPWLKGMKLIDTPGLGDLFNRFNDLVENYVPQADVIIFVTSTQFPLSETERTFLQLSLAPRQFSKIVFVLNMMDLIRNESDAQRVFAGVEASLLTVFPQANLFCASGLDELCRVQAKTRPNPKRAQQLERDFQHLRNTIHQSLLLNRDAIQLERIASEMSVLLNKIDVYAAQHEVGVALNYENLNSLISKCNNPTSELYQRIDVICEETTKQIEALQKNLRDWIDLLIDRFQDETIPSLGYVPYIEIQRHFLFFIIDKLTKALQGCFDAQQPEIVDLIHKSELAIAAELQKLHNSVHLKIEFSVERQLTWTYLDSYETLAQQGISSVFTLVDRFLLIVKEMMEAKLNLSENQKRKRYQENLLNALPDFRLSIHKEIEQIYSQLSQTINTNIRDKSSSLFRDFGTAMQKAADLQGENKDKITETQDTLNQLRRHVADTQNSLAQLQKSIQPELIGV